MFGCGAQLARPSPTLRETSRTVDGDGDVVLCPAAATAAAATVAQHTNCVVLCDQMRTKIQKELFKVIS